MRVRPLSVDDAARVAVLAGQLGYEATAAQVAARFLALEDDGLFGAEDGGLCGWVHVWARRSLHNEPFAEIEALVVDEARRSQGIGAALVAAAEAWASAAGLPIVRVRSNVKRERAHAFYRRLGYRDTKTSLLFEKRLARSAS